MSDFFTRNALWFAIVFFCALNVLLVFIWARQSFGLSHSSSSLPAAASYPESAELRALEKRNASFSVLSAYFTALAEKKGGAYAFDVLRAAPLPKGTDLHLLGHTVGDVLYKQEGVAGMRVCTSDFRNACSHSIVVGLFFDKGESALAEIAQACRKAPGGSGAYTMCFHGLGHGILAYVGYDLKRGIALCEKTGTKEYQSGEPVQCIGGSVMELISGGFHNREQWEKQRKIYFSRTDPLAPCDEDFMPQQARTMCYTYLTPYLWEAVGMDAGNPGEKDFERALALCGNIPAEQAGERDACMGGFGKEFVGLVQGRDIRQGSVENINDDQLKQIYGWCTLAPDSHGTTMCSEHALAALYWGGENDRSIALRYCGIIDDPADQKRCYENLIGSVASYVADKSYRSAFCGEVPDTLTAQCKTRLL